MSTVPHPNRPNRLLRRAVRVLTTVALAAALATVGIIALPAPAHAAAHGTGFGEWAPISPYGWHGSMLIDGVHTYCILPGAPAPTGPSTDHGISDTAAGLSPQQLTGINLLVTKYGQTADPVQAAAVGWAVKAIANWAETLHHFGYPGDSLAGAVHWTFSALAPQHDAEIQRLAVAYYEEAQNARAGAPTASGSVSIGSDPDDPARGTVRVDAATPATGQLVLTAATFDATGTETMPDATTGVPYAITAHPPLPGRPYSVAVTGSFSAGLAPAVRHYTTAGGQDTAGPAGEVHFDVAAADAAPRHPLFTPTIATQVSSRYVASGPFVDDVSFAGPIEQWPRAEDASHLPVTATAVVYRTDSEPESADGSVPADAVPVGSLAVETDAERGPSGPYRVTSLWELPGPGFYTAVWTIDRAAQRPEVAAHLPAGHRWVERFGERTQVVMVSRISSRADPAVPVGSPVRDAIIVAAPLPTGGLIVSSAMYRAPAGMDPAEVCVDENLVWASASISVDAPGEYTVISPAVTAEGTYVWQERAVDAGGELVHLGVCGTPSEITEVSPVPASAAGTPALAATGGPTDAVTTSGAVAVWLLTGGATLLLLARRRRFVRSA